MRLKPTLIALCAAQLLLASPVHAEDDAILATVNGVDIHQSDYDRFVANVSPKLGKLSHEQVMDELTTRELLRQDAVANGLDKTPEMQAELEGYRQKLMVASRVRGAVAENPVTDDELQALYDKHKASLTQSETKARHILVKERDEAVALIAELDQGADFATLAREHSTGPSGKEGGELGWFSKGQMVPEFSAAAAGLEPGSYSKEPVQTQFGWHVILVEDRRENTPSFEDVRERLVPVAQQQHVGSYIAKLREKADVVIK